MPQIPHRSVPMSLDSFFFKGHSSISSLIEDIMVKPPRLTRALKVSRNIEIAIDCKLPPNYVSSFYGSFMIVFDALR